MYRLSEYSHLAHTPMEQASDAYAHTEQIHSFIHNRHSHKHSRTQRMYSNEPNVILFVQFYTHAHSLCLCLSPCIFNSFIHTRSTRFRSLAVIHFCLCAFALSRAYSPVQRLTSVRSEILYYCCIVQTNRSEYTVNSSSRNSRTSSSRTSSSAS